VACCFEQSKDAGFIRGKKILLCGVTYLVQVYVTEITFHFKCLFIIFNEIQSRLFSCCMYIRSSGGEF
jgi:hypothetical protein